MLNKIHKYQFLLAFSTILTILIFTRFLGNNFDAGLHLHPDERWLIMVAGKIHFFDQLNPDFFAYGSLPIYILKGTGQFIDYLFATHVATYDGLLMIGRILVSIADILVAVLVFFITRKITQVKAAPYLAMLLYTLMFFPIQNSNFFIVDNFLNLFLALAVFLTASYLKKPSWKVLGLLTVTLAAMLATKVTAIIVVPIILGTTLVKTIQRHQNTLTHETRLCRFFIFTNLIFWLGLGSLFLFMPYAFLEHAQFVREVKQQLDMGKDPYVFPYTLQYVDTTPYLYYLKNIFWWGAGPLISLLAGGGIIVIINQLVKQWHKNKNLLKLITQPLSFILMTYSVYFLVIGKTAVKFMRYLLPIYPFVAISATFAVIWFLNQPKPKWKIKRAILISILALATIWTNAFLRMYLSPHTRIQATDWMLKNIPPGGILAVEHWDDRLPLYRSSRYHFVELPLYEYPDNSIKWQLIDQYLNRADYIIIASKRLFAPLMKLNNCQKYKKCYPKTAQYYRDLFANKRGFAKVAEFDYQPILDLALFKLTINDNSADESFGVYDHPHVIIFKKN